jgi:hypothetical protein
MGYQFEDMIEVTLPDAETFLKIKETLTRIGIASKKEKVLYQSCHILHKQGKYAICHFKELFALDGKPTNFTEDDIARRNTIANLLAEWKLVNLVDPSRSAEPVAPVSSIKILPFKEKKEWTLNSKYTVGKKREE